jgi:hypothetical protein
MTEREPDYIAGLAFALVLFCLCTLAFVITGVTSIGSFDVAQLLFLMGFAVILILTIAVAKLKKEGWDEAL